MRNKTVLIIGMVWPEPGSSAAGTRIVQLVRAFTTPGNRVIFASAASKSDFSFDLTQLGVLEREIRLNDPGFNDFIREIQPDIVVFDRFVSEEQYGWRVHQERPEALKILDTEDLHFLRQARQEAFKKNKTPDPAQLYTELAKREIASIYRCDLSLIISETEMNLLQNQFNIAPSLLYYLPFLEEMPSETVIKQWKTFDEREGFVFIGNFLHEPNWHTLQQLKTSIWPTLSKLLPGVSMHIYGAYASPKVLQLAQSKDRFFIHGRAKDAQEAIARHRILLAPIRFGAGVKGKFIDAMQTGTPSITTSIGAEAMAGDLEWNGIIEDNPDDFIREAVQLYKNQKQWEIAQQNGLQILRERYDQTRFIEAFITHLEQLEQQLALHRQQNFFGQLLQQHTANSSKYFSLWIEEKEKKDKPAEKE